MCVYLGTSLVFCFELLKGTLFYPLGQASGGHRGQTRILLFQCVDVPWQWRSKLGYPKWKTKLVILLKEEIRLTS